MTPMLAPWAAAVAEVPASEPTLALVSLLTARREDQALTDAAFWERHAREPVRAADGLVALAALGCDVLVDLGGRPVLAGVAGQLPQLAVQRLATATKDADASPRALAEALGALFVAGVEVDWAAWDARWSRHRVPLPTYPFDRRRFWLDEARTAATDWAYAVQWAQAPKAP